ncbi:retrovirus-related Pol polyprotein from transposon 297 [Trichonephila clavipes]|nr:retrovirus-related Pol polyprotein from transposon 297 [Trichonephila clavipes]
MAGWYQKFIPQYADICEPLYRLKKKGAKFNWSTEAQDSFDKIKRALTEAPVFQLPNFTEQFNLFTDASGVGIGAVLNQNHRPIAFASRTLNKAERNYTVTERKCSAVIWALNKFKTYFGFLPVKVTVNIDQVHVYRPRQSNTISSDSHVETLYEGQRLSDRSSRSQPGKLKGSRKTSSEQNNGHKSSKGNAGWEDLRLKRKVESKGSGDRRPNNPSQGSQSIAGPSHQQDSRQDKSPTVASRHEGRGQYNKARGTKTTKNGTNRAAERRTVRSKQTTALIPCPYYLRSRLRQPEGFPEERRNSGIESIPQNNIRRRSLSMEALDGDPVDRSG